MTLKRKGFTLIELLVVIAIIAILAAVALIQFQGAQADARDARRQADLRAMQSALELYLNETPTGYPDTDGDGARGWTDIMSDLNAYMPSIIEDPDGTANIFYCTNADNSKYILQASLETDTAVSGDIDDDSGWTDQETCEGSALAATAGGVAGGVDGNLDCDDGGSEDVEFCLGATTP